MSYRTKSIPIEAMHWTGDWDAAVDFFPDAAFNQGNTGDLTVHSHTDGYVNVPLGKWVTRDEAGLIAIWTPQQFDMRFEPEV